MFQATVNPLYSQQFQERVKTAYPLIESIREFIVLHQGDNYEISLLACRIAGSFAAWLTGRIGEFNGVDVYIQMGERHPFLDTTQFKQDFSSKLKHSVWETFEFHSEYGPYNDVYAANICNIPVQFMFVYDPLDYWFRRFDFIPCSVNVGLFNLDDIRTAECRCMYENYYIFDAVDGTARYPFVYAQCEVERIINCGWYYEGMLRVRDEADKILRSSAGSKMRVYVGHGENAFISGWNNNSYKRILKYINRLYDNSLPDDSLNFLKPCENCKRCDRIDALARKYLNKWIENVWRYPTGTSFRRLLQTYKNC